MASEETALTTVEVQAPAAVDLGTLQAHDPAGMVAAASAVANALAPVVEERKLFAVLSGRKHVYVEGWTTLAMMLGLSPQEISVERVNDGEIYVAKVGLFRLTDGQMVGAASAECGGPDEPNWMERNGKPVPAYARRSMAITRATGKACRLSLSWIMKLAGYEGTPAEVMPSEPNGRDVTRAPSGGHQNGGGGTRWTAETWDGSETINFGKHKGTAWRDLPEAYVEWIIDKMDPPAKDYAEWEMMRKEREFAAQEGAQS